MIPSDHEIIVEALERVGVGSRHVSGVGEEPGS
jgi:hypothetical protein